MKLIENYLSGFTSSYSIFDRNTALSYYKSRDPFANKGNYGHALILAGSYGKMGAAVLASRACLSAGAGLLTAHLPSCGYDIMQSSLPEAMVSVGRGEFELVGFPSDSEIFQAVGIGPGIGTSKETSMMMKKFLKSFHQPMVIDADALNIISRSNDLLTMLNSDTILTPHPKEFDRLFGKSEGDLSRFEKAKKMAVQHKIIIVLKGHFTGIFKSDGNIFFNSSGNAGMAKAGSGDVLTGIITALLAQSYSPSVAASLGVYLHGCAGDMAATLYSEESMLPSDLIQCLGKTFLEWKRYSTSN